MNVAVLGVVALCSLVVYRRFGSAYFYQNIRRNNAEDTHLQHENRAEFWKKTTRRSITFKVVKKRTTLKWVLKLSSVKVLRI